MLDGELYQTWRAMNEAGHHEESLRMLRRLLEARPDDADLHLLLSQTLSAMNREADSLVAVYRAIECGEDDAAILTQAASRCFFRGDLATARRCIDRAKRIAPRGFPLKAELKEMDRSTARRVKGRATEERLEEAFEADGSDRKVAVDLARHLVRTGRTYAAYHIVARGLHHHPEDRTLRRLEGKLCSVVPDDVRLEAEQWARSGEPFAV